MFEANGRTPKPIDPAALRLAEQLAEARQTRVVVDREIVVVGRALVGFLVGRNPGKDMQVRLFFEHELTPALVRNVDTFRDLFAVAMAETFTIGELEALKAQSNANAGTLGTGEVKVAAERFHDVASAFGGYVLSTIGRDPDHRLEQYGLH
jgi:hypothetical protein